MNNAMGVIDIAYPSSARRMAGSRISPRLNLPLPNFSTESTQAAAHPVRIESMPHSYRLDTAYRERLPS